MICVKNAIIISVAAFAAGSFFASPVPAAIAAIIATDVQCNGCVGTTDLAGNAVTAAKIKDGEVKAGEIATNAVGASEIAADSVTASEISGVTKLLFSSCTITDNDVWDPGQLWFYVCGFRGADSDDFVIAQKDGSFCFVITHANAEDGGQVRIWIQNVCSDASPSTIRFSIIVYDT